MRGEDGRAVEVERGLLREGPGEVEGRGEELGVGGRGGPSGDEELAEGGGKGGEIPER